MVISKELSFVGGRGVVVVFFLLSQFCIHFMDKRSSICLFFKFLNVYLLGERRELPLASHWALLSLPYKYDQRLILAGLAYARQLPGERQYTGLSVILAFRRMSQRDPGFKEAENAGRSLPPPSSSFCREFPECIISEKATGRNPSGIIV